MLSELIDSIAGMKEERALSLARELLDGGVDPLKVLESCREAMTIVGQRFEECTYYLPELMLAGEMLQAISQMAKPRMTKELEVRRRGRVVIGTVQGDIHDIGKNIVTMLLDVHGFEVHDLGVDVPPQKFIDAIKAVQPEILGLSALLTVAFEPMKRTIQAITEAGLRDSLKIMIGGAPIDERIRQYSGADAYGADAMTAVELSKGWTEGYKTLA